LQPALNVQRNWFDCGLLIQGFCAHTHRYLLASLAGRQRICDWLWSSSGKRRVGAV